MLKRYSKENKFLDDALSSNSNCSPNVTATMVLDSLQHLYNLPYMGSTIKQLHRQVFQESNQQAKQKNKSNSKPKQFPKQTCKMDIDPKDQPHMKAKDMCLENNRGLYRNHQSNMHHNNIPHSNNSQQDYSEPDES